MIMTTTHAESSVWIPEPGTYVADPAGSSVEFRARHLFGLAAVAGNFRLSSALIQVASPLEGSAVKATIDAASFSTGNARRDKDVRSARFLDVDGSPSITFASTSVGVTDSAWMLEGQVTVRGKTVPVALAITESQPVDNGLEIVAKTRIDRYAHGITGAKGVAGRYLDLTIRLRAHATGTGR
jgi:polyisoprenoid-binding protein YceI